MPNKRAVLAHLHRDELIAVAEAFELEVADRRVKDQLIEAVAASRIATLDAILDGYKRDRLKELCRALGLYGKGETTPDLQPKAIETVIKQAKMLAAEWAA